MGDLTGWACWGATGLSLAAMWVAGSGRRWGWLFGALVVQPLWIAYAIATQQLAFIAGCVTYAAVQIHGYRSAPAGPSSGEKRRRRDRRRDPARRRSPARDRYSPRDVFLVFLGGGHGERPMAPIDPQPEPGPGTHGGPGPGAARYTAEGGNPKTSGPRGEDVVTAADVVDLDARRAYRQAVRDADLRLSDQELLVLRKSVAVLDPQHPTALAPATALVVIEELLELRRALERVGAQVGELQQLLEGAHRRQP